MAVAYGDARWVKPRVSLPEPCLFWVVPDVHGGFPSPWRHWERAGMCGTPPDPLTLYLPRILAGCEFGELCRAARVCRAWRQVVYRDHGLWLRAYERAAPLLELPPLDGRAERVFACALAAPFDARRALAATLTARRALRLAGGRASPSLAATASCPPMRETDVHALEERLGTVLCLAVREGLKAGRPLLTVRAMPPTKAAGAVHLAGSNGAEARAEEPRDEWELLPPSEWTRRDDLREALPPWCGCMVSAPTRPVAVARATRLVHTDGNGASASADTLQRQDPSLGAARRAIACEVAALVLFDEALHVTTTRRRRLDDDDDITSASRHRGAS